MSEELAARTPLLKDLEGIGVRKSKDKRGEFQRYTQRYN